MLNQQLKIEQRSASGRLPPVSIRIGEQLPYLVCCLLIDFWVAFPRVLGYSREPPDVLSMLMLVVLSSFLLYLVFGSLSRVVLVWAITLGPVVVLILGLSLFTKTEYDTSYHVVYPKPTKERSDGIRGLTKSLPTWAIPKVEVTRTPRQTRVLAMSPTDGICCCAYVLAMTHSVAMGALLLWLLCLMVWHRTRPQFGPNHVCSVHRREVPPPNYGSQAGRRSPCGRFEWGTDQGREIARSSGTPRSLDKLSGPGFTPGPQENSK